MEKVCPLCNGLAAVQAICPRCGGQLADGGALENFYGPYSPYVDASSWPDGGDGCVHLLYCQDCGYDVRRTWNHVPI
jgi:hypothetical protein